MSLFKRWETCFPNWKQDVEDKYTDDQINADVIKGLTPAGQCASGTGPHPDPPMPNPPTPNPPTPDSHMCPDGKTDAKFMLDHF